MDVTALALLLNSGDGGIMYTVMYGDDERIKKNNCKNRAIKVLWYVSRLNKGTLVCEY